MNFWDGMRESYKDMDKMNEIARTWREEIIGEGLAAKWDIIVSRTGFPVEDDRDDFEKAWDDHQEEQMKINKQVAAPGGAAANRAVGSPADPTVYKHKGFGIRSTIPTQELISISSESLAKDNGVRVVNYSYGYVWIKHKEFGKPFKNEEDAWADACQRLKLK